MDHTGWLRNSTPSLPELSLSLAFNHESVVHPPVPHPHEPWEQQSTICMSLHSLMACMSALAYMSLCFVFTTAMVLAEQFLAQDFKMSVRLACSALGPGLQNVCTIGMLGACLKLIVTPSTSCMKVAIIYS
jgi:hypothetical protein